MITINARQIGKIAKFFKDNKKFKAFDFTGDYFPKAGHPLVIEYFFVLSKHQFGFWLSSGDGYIKPMYAKLNGEDLKGSDYIWRVGLKLLQSRPEFFKEKYQREITMDILNSLWKCDQGFCPLPNITVHMLLMNNYGIDMMTNGYSPAMLVRQAAAQKSPALYMEDALKKVGGYKEDPLTKKLNMLIMILQNRPEKFLPAEDIPPIVDYHIQRLSLRTGIVSIKPAKLKAKLHGRLFVTRDEETEIRNTIHEAIESLKTKAGVGTPEIDWLFFSGRTFCPEMTEPDCGKCMLAPYCQKNVEMFQPIYRTTFY